MSGADRRSDAAIGSSRIARFLSASSGSAQYAPVSPSIHSYSAVLPPHSHSIVPGGLLVISYVTRLIPRASFTILFATRVRNAISNG
jgi:hypothetical protein